LSPSDYALGVWSLEEVTDPPPLFSADILEEEFVDWVENSYLLKRAFREVAIISGLVERQHPGKRKTGKQVTFSTDLIYDVLRKYEPGHLLLEAAWHDARARLTDVGRLGDLLDRAADTMLHIVPRTGQPDGGAADGDDRARKRGARGRSTTRCSLRRKAWPAWR
jgi:ATP-dependent Lhr-like helicase